MYKISFKCKDLMQDKNDKRQIKVEASNFFVKFNFVTFFHPHVKLNILSQKNYWYTH